jgi:competence protein ComEC
VRIDHIGLALAAGGIAGCAPFVPRGRAMLLAAAVGTAGLWWGSVRLEQLETSVLAGEAGRAGPAEIEVTGPAREGAFALRVPVRVLRFGALTPDERARLELPLGRAPPQGALLELVATVRRPRRASAGESFDEREYLRRQGVHVVLRADGFRQVGRRGGAGAVADRLRGWLSGSMAPGLTGERRAVIAGIVLGEDEGLSADLRDAFRASGLYHLLAVSGQNVVYVVIGALVLTWALGLPRWLGQVTALTAVTAYVLAVGWQPSVVRAGVAGALASLAWLAARPADRWYFLLVGAAVLLAANPFSLLEPGFQLSFAAVAAIFVLVPRVERWLDGYPVPRRLADVIAVSVACGLVTAPILWLHFGAVPLFSVASNALAFPVVGPLLGFAFIAAALDPVLPSAALAIAWVNGWLAAYLGWCARAVGGLPHAQATSLRVVGLVAVAVLVAALVARLHGPRRTRALALAATVLALVVAWRAWLSEGAAAIPPTGLRITFLDVGQGDATLIQVPEGAVLVDQGPPEAGVAEQLARLGVDRLSILLMTHPSRDNIGGAEDVVDRMPVDLVLDPDLVYENPYGDPALAEARRRGVEIRTVRAGQVFRLGGLRLEVLWPPDPGLPEADPNDRATVLVASFGETDALLPADAEANVTLPLRPPPVEILKVAHHGSADPQLNALLELVRPQIAIISVGRGNDYGHPTPSTLDVLQGSSGLAVYRTDEDGRITVESDGRRMIVGTGS